MEHDYAITRSNRKTIALYIRDGAVEVRAPYGASKRNIDRFVAAKEKWIADKLTQSQERMQRRKNFKLNYGDFVLYRGKEYPISARSGNRVGFDEGAGEFFIPPNLSSERIKAAVVQIYKVLAKRDLTNKVLEFAEKMSVTPSAVKINSAKTRWGSCSGKKSLNFSWRLIIDDDDLIDYVVVHELAHIKEMNHSARFWAIVASVFPDYKERQKRLKELTHRLGNEDWEVDWLTAAEEDPAFGEGSGAEVKSATEVRGSAVEDENMPAQPEAGLFRWHYADFKTVLSSKNGMNPYRGCTHGCIYCDSRSECYQMKHDFEDIEVKRNAAAILENQLIRRRQLCMISTGGMCDPYIPLEDELQVTRQCLEVIEKHGFGVAVLTKSARIMRDFDILKKINAKAKCVVQMTLTTFDEDLCRILEPNVQTTAERFAVLEACRDAGIETVVWLCPVLPFINDTEENLKGILDYCIRAKVHGIICFGFGTTMREGSRDYFYKQLDKHFPGIKQKYIHTFGNSYECPSPNNAKLMRLFQSECENHGILYKMNDVFEYLNNFDQNTGQLSLFD